MLFGFEEFATTTFATVGEEARLLNDLWNEICPQISDWTLIITPTQPSWAAQPKQDAEWMEQDKDRRPVRRCVRR
jgi:hypothetical protein